MELKPCPFCGNEDVGIAVGAYCNYENIFFFAVCDNCGSMTKSFRNRDYAENAWNRRAAENELI